MKAVVLSTTHADLDSREVSLEVLPSPSSEFKSWPGLHHHSVLSVFVSGFTAREIKARETVCQFHNVYGHEMPSTCASQSLSSEALAGWTI